VKPQYELVYALAFFMIVGLSSLPAHARHSQVSVITSRTALPVSTSGAEKVIVRYINPLHYQYSLQVSSTNISAPAPPTAIAPSATTTGVFPAPPTPPPPPPPTPTTTQPKKNTPEEQWKEILTNLGVVRKTVITSKQQTDSLLFTASSESQCYKDRLSFYSSFLLDDATADSLRQFAMNNRSPITSSSAPNSPSGSCRQPDGQWPFTQLQTLERDIYSLQSDLFDMTTMGGFKDWKDKNGDAYTAVTTLVGNFLTQVQALESGSDVVKNFLAAQSYNNFWRLRIEDIAHSEAQVVQAEAALHQNPSSTTVQAARAAHQRSRLEYVIPLTCSSNWYGRGRVDTITLHYTDTTAASPTDQSSQIAINSCLTPATVSTGIGMSFLRNQQFGFVSGRDPNNPASTISVIGATTDQQVTPLYALQYNIAIEDWDNGLGVQGAVGAALGSSSGTANIELIAGPAISIKHRAFFITPAFQLGRRDNLLPGFKVGDPQGSLTAVPIHSSWKPGFALTFTFSVAQ